ncbi:MAG: alpha/beta hydrolase, partial [Alphaproteobacteria bacterium]|nr:alpha/beta hydrolase [Alphaproteobacteria bacterium]
MAAGSGWKEADLQVAGIKLHLARAGSGRPVLVLHHDIGSPERLDFYDALADRFDVVVPHHPGYGRSERPQWL